jgi:TRAP-type mannitol/chloroaromatic compound transport system permease small subunit
MNRFKKLILFCDRLNEWVGGIVVSFAVLLFIGVIFSNVVMRYVFNTSFVFMAELEWHIFAFIFLIGAGFTLLHDGHVRVDIFYSMMNRKTQAWINALGVLLFLIPSCYLVLTTTIPWVIDAYRVGERSIDPGGLPARFLLKAALPAGYALILIQGVLMFCKNMLTLIGAPIENNGSPPGNT